MKAKQIIPIWWLIQLCVLLALGVRHLGHLFVIVLLIMSLVGYMFGERKVAIASSFGLASYSALTLIAMVVAIINMIISFKIIKVSDTS